MKLIQDFLIYLILVVIWEITNASVSFNLGILFDSNKRLSENVIPNFMDAREVNTHNGKVIDITWYPIKINSKNSLDAIRKGCTAFLGRSPLLVSAASCEVTELLRESWSKGALPSVTLGPSCSQAVGFHATHAQVHALTNILRSLDIPGVIIIYNSQTDAELLDKFREQCIVQELNIVGIDVTDLVATNLIGQLRRYAPSRMTVAVVVMLDNDNTVKVLQMGAICHESLTNLRWIALNVEVNAFDSLENSLPSRSNVLFISSVTSTDIQEWVLQDRDTLEYVIAGMAAKGFLGNETVTCFSQSPGETNQRQHAWEAVAEKYKKRRQTDCTRLGTVTLHNLNFGQIKHLFNSTVCDRANMDHSTYFPNTKNYGLNGKLLKVTTISHPPFAFQTENGDWQGLCVDLLDELSKILNFTFLIIPSPDKRWGADIGNGSYDGMVGQIQRKDVDVGMATFFITYGRSLVVDFTYPLLHTGYVVLMKAPSRKDNQAFVCFGPFTEAVWATLAAATVGAGLFSWMLDWFETKKIRRSGNKALSIGTHLWQFMGCVVQQSLIFEPKSIPSRSIVACMWIYAVVVVSIYNGNLIATLTAPKLTTIDTLEQLDSSGLEFGYERSTAIHGVLSSATGGIYKKLYDKVEPVLNRQLEDSIYTGYQRVLKQPNYAFLLWGPYFDTFSVNKRAQEIGQNCDFSRSRFTFYNNMNAFALQKNSSLNRLFSIEILRMVESGVIEHWRRKWYGITGSQGCQWQATSEYVQMTIAETQGMFYLLGLGIFLGLLVISGETVVQSLRGRQQKTRQNANINYVHEETRGVDMWQITNGSKKEFTA